MIGKPDAERTEIVKAYVVLKCRLCGQRRARRGAAPARPQRGLSAHAYPREIAFVAELPKTPSGKIQRFLLRNAEKAAASMAVN